MKPHQHDTKMNGALPINQFSKVFIFRDQQSMVLIGPLKNDIIADARLHFRHIQHIMSILPKLLDNPALHTFITKDVHATGSCTG